MTKLNATQIGYLRQAPASTANGCSANGPRKAMWRKLAKAGFIDETKDLFKRNAIGDAAVTEFDAALSEPCRAVLNAIRAGATKVSDMKGVQTALAAGLAVIGISSGRFMLTHDSERLADPVGEEGYFEKSGKLVKLVSVDEKGVFHVERVDGDSAGKGMAIPRESFFSKERWAAHVGE
jgi:hypothetical protein